MRRGRVLWIVLLTALLLWTGCADACRSSFSPEPGEEVPAREEEPPAPEEPQAAAPPQEELPRFSTLELLDAAVPVTEDSYLEVGGARCETERTPSPMVPGETDYRYRMKNRAGDSAFALTFAHQGGGEVLVGLTVEGEAVASYQEEGALETFGERYGVRWLDNDSVWVFMPGAVGIYDAVLKRFEPLGEMTAGLGYPEGFWEGGEIYNNVGLVYMQTDRMAPAFWVRMGETVGLFYHYTGRIRVLERLYAGPDSARYRDGFLWDEVPGGAYYGSPSGKLWYVDQKTGRKTLLIEPDAVTAVMAIENGLILVWREGGLAVEDLTTGAVACEPRGEYLGLLYDRYFVFREEGGIFLIDPYTDVIFTYPTEEEVALHQSILGTQYVTFGEQSRRFLLADEADY